MKQQYIQTPNLFNVGYIYQSPEFRQKQDLPSQCIANLCSSCSCYGKCNQSCLYPLPEPKWNYCLKPISKNCQCLRYVQPF